MQSDLSRRGKEALRRPITRTKILGVATSMRRNSHSTRTLRILLEAAQRYGGETRLLDLKQVGIPLYDPSNQPTESAAGNIKKISEAVQWAEAFVLASPDYHGSMSGTMKNFLDYFWEEFAGKTFGYLCTSHEKGLTVMDQMRTVVRQCYGWSMPYGISVNAQQDFNAKGEMTNVTLSRRLTMLARDLSVYGKLIREQFQRDLEDNDSYTFAARYRG